MMSDSVPFLLKPKKYLLSVSLKADFRPRLCERTDSEPNKLAHLVFQISLYFYNERSYFPLGACPALY